MAQVIVAGDTSGTVTLQAPAVAGSTTINLPTVSGGSFVVSDASGNVGIGTSSPVKKVDVSGTYRAQIDPSNSTFFGATLTLAGDNGTNQSGGRIVGGYEGSFGLLFQTSTAGQAGYNSDPSALTYATKMKLDTSGNVLVTSPAGLGYGTGSGGTVTQATSKSTAVTLNKPTGQITMNNAALAANTTVGFILNNSLLAGADSMTVAISSGAADYSAYQCWVANIGGGGVRIFVRNISGGSLSETLVLNFATIRGATA